MFQKTNEEKENQNHNENKVHVSHDEDERSFNCDDFLVHFNFKKHDDLNEEKYETKNE